VGAFQLTGSIGTGQQKQNGNNRQNNFFHDTSSLKTIAEKPRL
jgi:hypothetical protein